MSLKQREIKFKEVYIIFYSQTPGGRGGGGTPLQEANRDVPLDGVAFSQLE